MVSESPKKPHRWYRWACVGLVAAATVFIIWQVLPNGEREGRQPMRPQAVRADFVADLEAMGMLRSKQTRKDGALVFSHPPALSSDELLLMLRRVINRHGLVLTSAVNYADRRELYIELNTPGMEPVGKFAFQPEVRWDQKTAGTRGRIALIIDDFGYLRNRFTAGFFALPEPITISIIPGHRFSQVLAEEATRAGQEVIIHMPMEPENYNGRDEEEFILLYGMDADEIVLRVRNALQTLPIAVGMNNHEGSLATQDTSLLKVLAQELLDRDRFFVDSYTSPNTHGEDIMRRYGVPTAGRHVFLDNLDEASYIRRQLANLAARAERTGWAIGMGHVGSRHLKTLEVLQEEIPKLVERGFEFVFVSELVK